jgi:septum formation protein
LVERTVRDREVGSSNLPVPTMKVILASASLGRKHVLSQLKLPFEVRETNIDEDALHGQKPINTPLLRAQQKAAAAIKLLSVLPFNRPASTRIRSSMRGGQLNSDNRTLIITADTEVFLDGKIVGKPKDEADAIRIFQMLSGKTHTVITGMYVTLIQSNGTIQKQWKSTDHSQVTFRKMSRSDIKRYISLTECWRYTGGYALVTSPQDFIVKVEGSISNVIGLSLESLIPILENLQLI